MWWQPEVAVAAVLVVAGTGTDVAADRGVVPAGPGVHPGTPAMVPAKGVARAIAAWGSEIHLRHCEGGNTRYRPSFVSSKRTNKPRAHMGVAGSAHM